jgi:hypothetical protein
VEKLLLKSPPLTPFSTFVLLAPRRQVRKVTDHDPSSRANARDLRRRFLTLLETRISPDPGVYPELAEGVEMTTRALCAFARKIFLRDLRGENCLCFSGCGVAALGLYGKYYSQSARRHG